MLLSATVNSFMCIQLLHHDGLTTSHMFNILPVVLHYAPEHWIYTHTHSYKTAPFDPSRYKRVNLSANTSK